MKKIALLYAPEGGSVEKVAKLIANKFGVEHVELISVQNRADATILADYDKVIMGISTVGRDSWDSHYTKIGWDNFIPTLDQIDLSGKTVALYGLGNSLLYPDNFIDSLGILARKVEQKGAKIVGHTSAKDYDFGESAALVNGNFYGVAIDEDNESELTDQRLEKWFTNIKSSFIL